MKTDAVAFKEKTEENQKKTRNKREVSLPIGYLVVVVVVVLSAFKLLVEALTQTKHELIFEISISRLQSLKHNKYALFIRGQWEAASSIHSCYFSLIYAFIMQTYMLDGQCSSTDFITLNK